MNTAASAADSIQLLRPKQVMERLGLSRSTLYQYIKEGKFPAPFRIGVRATAWRQEQIEEYIRQRVENYARD